MSVVGDQLARVALTVIVFARTGSALLAALAFMATLFPALLGTAWFSGIADRLPRRRVLVVGDLLRAGLIATAAIPALPVGVALVFVVGLTLVDGPWGAARAALLRQACAGDGQYQRVTAIDETFNQAGQIGGYAVGGVMCAALGAHLALGLDAFTFVASGTLLLLTLQDRPASDSPRSAQRFRGWHDARTGFRAALAPACRLPLLLTWIGVGVAIAPEGVAVPWATALHSDASGAGLLLAANPVGAVVALLVIARIPAERAGRWIAPLVLVALAPLVACAAGPDLEVAVGLVTLSGVGLTYSTLARVQFAAGIPDAVRGRAFGIAATGLTVAQGLGLLLAGALAQAFDPATSVALCGVVGAVGCAFVAVVARPPRGRHAAGAVALPDTARESDSVAEPVAG
jgi:MFS family permease